MTLKALTTWRIASSAQPFYPISVQCIGYGDEYAVCTYTAHTISTFIIRNFKESIANDRPPQKSTLHGSLEPDVIQEVTVGANESIVLMANGRLKYFVSSKKLLTVEHLHSVKCICATIDGFALIKSSLNGRQFFVEIHAENFPSTEDSETKSYDISLDGGTCQSSWHQSRFKIKELHFPAPAANKFLERIFRGDVSLNEQSDERFLFYSIDSNLFSLHSIEASEHFVIPILTCTATIVDFWSSKRGDWMAVLLSSGTVMLLCLDGAGCDLHHELVYFGSEITAFALIDDLFIYSNDVLIEWVTIELRAEPVRFKFDRKAMNLPGIAALTVLPEFSLALAISENCHFYTIQLASTTPDGSSEWHAVDGAMVKQLKQLKLDLIELTDAYDNLCGRRQLYQYMSDAIKLKRADNVKQTHRFVGVCSATKTPPTLSANDELQTINVTSTLPYDRNSSFFVVISLIAVIYANEFDTCIWNLRCRWLNDAYENEYANVKLTTESLLKPLKFIVHLRQRHLPAFSIDVNTIAKIGDSFVYLSFPVHLTQPNYCELLQILPPPASSSMTPYTGIRNDGLTCRLKLPQGIAFKDIFGQSELEQTIQLDQPQSYEIRLLGKRLMIAQQIDDVQTIELRCNDAATILYTKAYVYDKIQRKLSRNKQIIRVTANAPREYTNFDNFGNFVADSMQYNHNDQSDRVRAMLECIGKIRLVPAIEYVE